MITKSDCFLKPNGVTLEQKIYRASKFNVLMGCIDGNDIAVTSQRVPPKAMGYVNPLVGDSWWAWQETYGWKNLMRDKAYSGLQIDCVFDNRAHFGLDEFERIAQDITPHPIIPNFGDFASWAGKNPATREFALYLGQLAPWHFVQVAYNMNHHTAQKWQTLRAACNLRLSAGKTLILGMYDLNRQHELLAAYLMETYSPDGVIWNYKSKATDDDVEAMFNTNWSYE